MKLLINIISREKWMCENLLIEENPVLRGHLEELV